MKPKRFLVFVFTEFYPSGGWNDLGWSFDTEAEATSYALAHKGETVHDCAHIVDLETGTYPGTPYPGGLMPLEAFVVIAFPGLLLLAFALGYSVARNRR